MPAVRLTRRQFDSFLVPILSKAAARNRAELQTAAALIYKMERLAQSKVVPLNKNEAMELSLVNDTGTLELTQSELSFLLKQVERAIPTFTVMGARELWELIRSLESALEPEEEEEVEDGAAS
jgi:hypothetical protein